MGAKEARLTLAFGPDFQARGADLRLDCELHPARLLDGEGEIRRAGGRRDDAEAITPFSGAASPREDFQVRAIIGAGRDEVQVLPVGQPGDSVVFLHTCPAEPSYLAKESPSRESRVLRYAIGVWLKQAQRQRFEERMCTAFAEAAPRLSLAQKLPRERLEVARGFLHGYTRASFFAGLEEAGELPPNEESLLRGMVGYAMYAHLFAYQMTGLLRPRDFIQE